MGKPMEAFSTRMPMGPSSAFTVAAMASTWLRSRASAFTARARPPLARISATTAWAAASEPK